MWPILPTMRYRALGGLGIAQFVVDQAIWLAGVAQLSRDCPSDALRPFNSQAF